MRRRETAGMCKNTRFHKRPEKGAVFWCFHVGAGGGGHVEPRGGDLRPSGMGGTRGIAAATRFGRFPSSRNTGANSPRGHVFGARPLPVPTRTGSAKGPKRRDSPLPWRRDTPTWGGSSRGARFLRKTKPGRRKLWGEDFHERDAGKQIARATDDKMAASSEREKSGVKAGRMKTDS